ncbi:MAG: hypothetical protein DRI94_04205 [Bacteroidetes bacterium]|nr:MAG: hypothetical protein DRI94_04205 [Bacteroidota bacterium]
MQIKLKTDYCGMNKKQKIYAIISLALIVLTVVLYILFSKQTLCKKVEIEFVDTGNQNIISKEDVKQIIFSEYKNLLGSPIDNVNLGLLERKIERYPSIKNADVFKEINGVLGIKVEQRKPILRVFSNSGKGFYIDEEGELMPLSDKGTVRVLTSNGNINYNYKGGIVKVYSDTTVSKTLKELYTLAKYIDDDDFLKAQTEQVYVTNKNEYELVPVVGNQIIMLGDMYDYEKKLKHLKQFYLHYLNQHSWKKYTYINLKYKGQIVCTKR